jgi:hypothetical protein
LVASVIGRLRSSAFGLSTAATPCRHAVELDFPPIAFDPARFSCRHGASAILVFAAEIADHCRETVATVDQPSAAIWRLKKI